MKWLLSTAAILATLWVLYVVLANLALRSTSLRKAINRHPDRFSLDWTSASTWIPGVFHVRGVHFVGQGMRSVYYGRMNEARFRVDLLPLFRREIRSPQFTGAGVEFRLTRPKPESGGVAAAEEAPNDLGFPTIPGLESLPRRTAPRSIQQPSPWRIHARQVRIREIEQVWVHQFRHQGPGELEASLDMQIDGPVHIRLAHLDSPSATVEYHGVTIARSLLTRAKGELGPLVFGVDDEPPERLYDHLTVDAEIRGDLETLGALKDRVGPALPSEFAGSGHLDGRLNLRRGVLEPGTHLRVESPHLALGVGGITFRGAAVIEDTVTSPQRPDTTGLARLRLRLDDLEVSHAGQVIASAPGRVLELESATHHLTLARPFTDAEVRFLLSPITVTNAAFLNQWIPASTGVRIESGHLRAEANLRAGGSGPGSGGLKLEGTGLVVDVRGQRCQADLHLEAPLQLGPLGDHRGRIDGTSLTLSNVVVDGASQRSAEPWHARLEVPRGEVQVGPKEAWSVSGDVDISLRDTRPLVAVLTEQDAVPGWIRLMPTLHRLEGTARLRAGPDLVEIRDAQITGAQVEMRAELELSEGRTRGIVYAEYGPVGAGFDLRGERSQWRIFGARRWYADAAAHPFDATAAGGEPDHTPGQAGGGPESTGAAAPAS